MNLVGWEMAKIGVCKSSCWSLQTLANIQLLQLLYSKIFMHKNVVCFYPRVSFDEGRSWTKYSFTSTPLFVDGSLVDPGIETQIMT